jgi:hypothetical protein
MTDVALATPARTPTGPVLATYRWLMRTQLIIAAWALLLIAVAATVAIVIVDRVGTVQYSIVGFSRQGIIWLPFSLAIIWAVSYVNVHVAMGLTRRALGRATVLAALSTSAVYAVGCVGLIQVERAVYSAMGWRHVIMDGLAFMRDASQVGLLLGDYVVAAAGGLLCGLLCGAVFYRVGGWWGTLAIPLTVGPVVLIQSGMTADVAWLSGDLAAGTDNGGLARAAISAAILLAVAVAYRAVLRTTPIQPAPLV